MRLFCGVFDHGRALRLHGRQHDVGGRADRNHVEVDIVPGQAVGGNVHHPVFQAVLRPQRGEPFQMLVDRPDPQVAASRHGDDGVVEPAEERTEKIIGAAHVAGELFRGDIGSDRPGIDFERGFIEVAHTGAHIVEDSRNGSDICNIRDIFNTANAV